MVCFVMETRLDTEGFNNLYGDLSFQNKIIVKHPDAGGGLAFLWKNDIRFLWLAKDNKNISLGNCWNI